VRNTVGVESINSTETDEHKQNLFIVLRNVKRALRYVKVSRVEDKNSIKRRAYVLCYHTTIEFTHFANSTIVHWLLK
jgi:hypothetical protein